MNGMHAHFDPQDAQYRNAAQLRFPLRQVHEIATFLGVSLCMKHRIIKSSEWSWALDATQKVARNAEILGCSTAYSKHSDQGDL